VTDIYSTSHEWLYGLALDGYGRVVATGGADDYLAIARWTSTGALDTSLAGVGKVIVKYGNARTRGNALAIDSQNRIAIRRCSAATRVARASCTPAPAG
jgi:hypothetical protein